MNPKIHEIQESKLNILESTQGIFICNNFVCVKWESKMLKKLWIPILEIKNIYI